MKIVVTTATRNVGSRVTRLLPQAGVRPTLLMRDPGKLDAPTRALVDAVQGDQLDPDAVVRATEGADALFWVDPPTDDPDPIAGLCPRGRQRRARDPGARHRADRVPEQRRRREAPRRREIDGLGRTEELLDDTGASVHRGRTSTSATLDFKRT